MNEPIPSTDPRLDWQPRHDERSRNFGIRKLIPAAPEIAKTWEPGVALDQGREGACVGFGWTADLLASPRPDRYATAAKGNAYAKGVYAEAQKIDEFAGEDYEGTSVLAGAKVIQSRRYITEYRWAFGIEDVRAAVISEGPVVIGIPWYAGMYDTRPSGLLECNGDLAGGHCILVHGYHPNMRIAGEDSSERFRVFKLRNSWGFDWGIGGTGYITYDDLSALLKDQGEACVPVGRKLVRL